MTEECREIIEVAEGPSVCKPAEPHAAAVQQESAYGIKVWIDKPYDEVLASTKHALAEEGLQIITETDIRKLLQNKLGIGFPHYKILGVSDPKWIHEALDLDQDIGLLIPCNMVVYEQNEGTILEAVDTIALYAIADSARLADLARLLKQKFQDVIDHVASGLA